jgi:prepilin signal peptidase PulO-like enzyme (type II secretory pathway)
MFEPIVPVCNRVLSILSHFCGRAMPNMPPETWWLVALVLLVLGASAKVDAFTSSVPDPLVFLGLIAVLAVQGSFVSWDFAAAQLAWALVAAAVVWGVNHLWYLMAKQDAIGMGDAKWTMLAVAAFDIKPVLIAWGLGACLAVVWMGAVAAMHRPIRQVYFAPFLFIGLIAGIYWLRLRGATV